MSSIAKLKDKIVSGSLDTNFARLYGDGAAGDAHAVLSVDAGGGSIHSDGAAGDHQIVLGHDAVLIMTDDMQFAASVDGQIFLGKDRAVGGGVCGILTVGEGIVRALCQRQKDLIRLPDDQGGTGFGGQIQPTQYQLDFLILRGVDDDASIRACARQQIGALGGYGNRCTVGRHSISADGKGVSVKNGGSRYGFVGRIGVPGGYGVFRRGGG